MKPQLYTSDPVRVTTLCDGFYLTDSAQDLWHVFLKVFWAGDGAMLKCKCLVNCSHSPVGVSKSPKHEEESLNSDENYNLWLSLRLIF